jgi:hypothetical protein
MEQEKSNSTEAQSIQAQTFGIFYACRPRAEKCRLGFRDRGGEARLCWMGAESHAEEAQSMCLFAACG